MLFFTRNGCGKSSGSYVGGRRFGGIAFYPYGQLTDEEWQKYTIAQGNLANASIYIDDTPGIRITEIRSRSRKLAQETGNLGLILIDYLQLITGTGRENRQQEVSEISRQLKILAKELKVPVIALSQLSRGVEQRQDKRPVLSEYS